MHALARNPAHPDEDTLDQGTRARGLLLQGAAASRGEILGRGAGSSGRSQPQGARLWVSRWKQACHMTRAMLHPCALLNLLSMSMMKGRGLRGVWMKAAVAMAA